MNKLIFFISVWIIKLIALLISFLRLGQASNLPGKIGLKLKKELLADFELNESCKVIVITGTNGKSTTAGMLSSILRASGKTVVSNNMGANLQTGIVTVLAKSCNLFGKVSCDFLVLEVDEATLPHVSSQIKVDVIAVTNFFRDQLDRFGELDTTVKLIEKGIENSPNALILLNADDTRAAFINANQRKIYYGLNIEEKNNQIQSSEIWLRDPEEVTLCPKCGSNLIFHKKYLAHLGEYSCSNCDLKRPELNFFISDLKTDNLSSNFNLVETSSSLKNNFFLPMIGTFNLYNALCAISICKTMFNVKPVQIQKGFQAYSTIFGRGEKIVLKSSRGENSTAWIYLIKNPTGTTEVLKTLYDLPNARFLIAINDNYADGRDVSWLWDARFEMLANSKKEIFISGKRAFDMALRIKYAGVDEKLVKVNQKIKLAINEAAASLESNETLYILPTYTVLLEMQRNKICK